MIPKYFTCGARPRSAMRLILFGVLIGFATTATAMPTLVVAVAAGAASSAVVGAIGTVFGSALFGQIVGSCVAFAKSVAASAPEERHAEIKAGKNA